jgi:hypothetical protein
MDPRPKQKPDAKTMLRRAARDIPLAALVGGLAYGITRTGLEAYVKKNPDALNFLHGRGIPLALSAASSYAGYRLNKELQRRITEPT